MCLHMCAERRITIFIAVLDRMNTGEIQPSDVGIICIAAG